MEEEGSVGALLSADGWAGWEDEEWMVFVALAIEPLSRVIYPLKGVLPPPD